MEAFKGKEKRKMVPQVEACCHGSRSKAVTSMCHQKKNK